MDIREKVEKLQNHLKANNYKFVIDECNKLIQKFPYNSFLFNLERDLNKGILPGPYFGLLSVRVNPP